MFNIDHFKTLNKDEFYESLLIFSQGLMEGERDLIANLANISSLLFHTMQDINWAGFYILRDKELVLGPFHGKPACIRIALGKGVCGTAVSKGVSQLVEDVHSFPGHIACDGDTNSEIVIPITNRGKVVAVLDIDSPMIKRFDVTDQLELEKLVSILEDACDWEA
jgi:GAF domain-containing protein